MRTVLFILASAMGISLIAAVPAVEVVEVKKVRQDRGESVDAEADAVAEADTVVTAAMADAPAATRPALFDIKCEKEGDAVQVRTDAGRTILQITSKRGIGGATITRTGDHWPREIVLRVHLRGLEQLSLSTGDLRLNASVLSHSGHPRLLHLWAKNVEGPPPAKDSPYWMAIAAFNAQGKPVDGLPDKGGWFEMTVPRALLVEREKTLSLGWIDFFR